MISRSESWPARRASARRSAAAAAVGVALFAGSWGLLHLPPLARHQIVDTPVYQRYGDAVLGGKVPYRDLGLEYPPGALPLFVLPSLAAGEDYRAAFEALHALCGAAVVVLVAVALVALGASDGRLFAGTALAGLAPLALGPVVLTRFDLWPALLTVAALAALLAGRERLGAAAIGLAVSAKLYPAVLVPLALVYVGRRRGPREAGLALLLAAAAFSAVVVPFAILAPDGLVSSLGRQTGRPLQIESLGASLLLAAHQAGAYVPTVVSTYGLQNLHGDLPDALGALQLSFQVLAVVCVWLLFASGRGGQKELAAAAAASVAAFMALGKVLSPQFLLWLAPLVPLVAGRRGLTASALFLAGSALTHLWFPARYWDLAALEPGPTWLLVARNAVLVALAGVLAAAIRERGAARSA